MTPLPTNVPLTTGLSLEGGSRLVPKVNEGSLIASSQLMQNQLAGGDNQQNQACELDQIYFKFFEHFTLVATATRVLNRGNRGCGVCLSTKQKIANAYDPCLVVREVFSEFFRNGGFIANEQEAP